MRKQRLIITALIWAGCAGFGFAEASLDSLRKEIQQLRKLDNKENKQQAEVKEKLRVLGHELTVKENEPEFSAAVASLKVQKPAKPRKVLVYSRTKGYRHKSIPYGIYTLTELGKRTGAFSVVATEDPKIFLSDEFMGFDGVIMLNTSGKDAIPKGKHRDVFEKFLEQDRGLIGIHAATDCHKDWDEYLTAMGGFFDGHPWNARSVVTLHNEEPDHPICNHIKCGDTIRDEIYQYRDDEHFTREKLRILLSLDLSGKDMKKAKMKRADNDYAVSWIRNYAGSRVFYSNLGHNNETYCNQMALQHFLNGIQFALGDLKADARPSAEVGNGSAKPLPAGF